MGKGRRLRQTRDSEALSPEYPFAVDVDTVSRLGTATLSELAANLWPRDCQTCGWSLGSARPGLCVDDMLMLASASLHHERCRAPQWHDGFAGASAPLVSWDVYAWLQPERTGSEQWLQRPIFALNPTLEQVLLTGGAGQWRLATVERFRQMGLGGASTLDLSTPVPDMLARLEGADLTIALDDTGEAWSVGTSVPFREQVHDLGGVLLAISTAFVPSEMSGNSDLFEAMHRDQVAMGWIALDGAQPPPATTAPPESLRTFQLHWGQGHAAVGAIMASTDPGLSAEDAQAWAEQHLPDGEGRLPWRQHHRDTLAWFSLDALAAEHYALRHHPDSWKLIQVHARFDADTLDKSDVLDWATRAVRIHAGYRILHWVDAAEHNAGFTTQHGSAVPR